MCFEDFLFDLLFFHNEHFTTFSITEINFNSPLGNQPVFTAFLHLLS